MKYAGIIYNDFTAAPGISLTFFTQGCPHRCHGCHNPETWDYDGGLDFTADIFDKVIEGLRANNIKRNLCIMGGEPLCPENLELTTNLVNYVKEKSKDTVIYLWTGYLYENVANLPVLAKVDYLIDGPYIESLRDITLKMRGSSNQRILDLHNAKNYDTI